ncbi:MAG TPA: sigma-70 family RNA polymerase sigma factor [Deltaproteobacteria bacterium]|nr:sigma-70 family RNA polymerase sigma factor [Deltaproteobacteria bacterium]
MGMEDEIEEETGEQPEADPPRRKLPAGLPALKRPPTGMRSKDLLNFYLSEVRRYPLLTPEEEKEYAVRFVESGDREAAERLVTANLRLVIKIAFQYHRQWANVLDLIQEGNVGLVEALSRYDPSREIRFSSYAQYWIRAMILRFLLDNFRLVRLGSTRAGRKLFFQLQKERDRLMKEGIKPTSRMIAESLGVAEHEVDAVDQHMRAPALSLHAPAGDDPEGRTLSEVVPERDPHDPEDSAARSELSSIVQDKLQQFAENNLRDDRERTIWEQRMIATDPVSLSSLGEHFGVSKERIRQVEARMKKKLKAFLEAELGDEIDFEFSER